MREREERAAREEVARSAREREETDRRWPLATPMHTAALQPLTYRVSGVFPEWAAVEVTRDTVVSEGFLGFGRKVERRVVTERQVHPVAGEVSITMVVVPPCRFSMGSQEVYLSRAYAIATAPVTQTLWMGLTGTNPSRSANNPTSLDCPVAQVSWYDAVRFCNALSERVGLRPAYRFGQGLTPNVDWDADGFRLPTEAEWECAAKAGTQDIYAGGNDFNSVAWTDANSGGSTHPVARKRANSWGLHDMSGNVGEWCWDVYGDYTSGRATDPVGAGTGSLRVSRGGSWGAAADFARAAKRSAYDPALRSNVLGLRIVKTVP